MTSEATAGDQPATVQGPEPSALPEKWKLLAEIAAPVTVLTALAYYFGWSYAFWLFRYFGVPVTMLGLTVEDYLRISVDGLMRPVAIAAIAGLIGVWLHRFGEPLLSSRVWHRWVRVRIAVAAAAGLVLAVVGILALLVIIGTGEDDVMAPLSVIAGIVLLVYASRGYGQVTQAPRRPRRRTTESILAFLLISLCLFVAVHDYAVTTAFDRARADAAELPNIPDAALYSRQRLGLVAGDVRETVCEDPEAAYAYRYDGLKLLLRSGDVYLFLPAQWTREEGRAIVISKQQVARVDFTSARDRPDRFSC